MGKSANGPDMQDCLMYLHSMDEQAKLDTTILITPQCTATAWSCTISLLSCQRGVVPGEEMTVLHTQVQYPDRNSATFGGALYRAIVEHDKQLSAADFFALL